MSLIGPDESIKINAQPTVGIITDRMGEAYTIEVNVLTSSTQDDETSILNVSMGPLLSSAQAKSLDFEIVKEPWNKYELGDYTILKTRVILTSITRSMNGDKRNYALGLQNLQSTISPNELKGTPGDKAYSKQELESEVKDIRYNTLAEEWNEYIVDDGTKIRLKTTVTNVKKSDKFSRNGDPIYLVSVNALPQIIPPKTGSLLSRNDTTTAVTAIIATAEGRMSYDRIGYRYMVVACFNLVLGLSEPNHTVPRTNPIIIIIGFQSHYYAG